MTQLSLQPRFSDTDALGHINNCSYAQWFEEARTPIFKIFTPKLNVLNWKLIVVKTNYQFHEQCYYGKSITIKTKVSRIGKSSFDINHKAYQNKKLICTGEVTAIKFNYKKNTSSALNSKETKALSLI